MLNWKLPEKNAAIHFTINDIHLAKSSDYSKAGGDADKEYQGLVNNCLTRRWKTFVLNPEDSKLECIRNRNKSFNSSRGNRENNWFCDKKVGEHSAEILFVENDEHGAIANFGIFYCRLLNGTISLKIGTMSGSWNYKYGRQNVGVPMEVGLLTLGQE